MALGGEAAHSTSPLTSPVPYADNADKSHKAKAEQGKAGTGPSSSFSSSVLQGHRAKTEVGKTGTGPSSSSSSSLVPLSSSSAPAVSPGIVVIGNGSADEDPDAGPSLNPEIWGGVPSELLERIIARLPVTSVLRFRAVCRRWNQLPFEKEFPKLHPHQVGACPPFLSPQYDILYIEGSGKWRTIPFHFLPSRHVILEASAGGLLLLSKSNRSSRLVESFYVCNPVTKQWRELRGFSVRSICVACIDVNQSTLNFNVVIAGWADRSDRYMGRSPVIEMFDSTTNSWVRKAGFWDADFCHLRGLVLVHDTLYLAIHSRNFASLKVIACNLEQGVTEVFAGFGDRSKFHCFGQHCGNLTVVVQRRGFRVIEIWQLKKQGNGGHMWAVLDRLAEEKLNAFSTAAVAGGFVFFNYYDEPIALYDLRDQSWRWVDFPPGRKFWLGMRPLAFQPSFVPLKPLKRAK